MWRTLHDNWWKLVREGEPRTVPEAMLLDLLGGASGLFGAGVALRNRAYARGWLPSRRVDCPVISVGNLTVGGTGKTVCVAFLVDKLRARFPKIAVLSRGYGSRGRYCLCWEDGNLKAEPISGGIGRLADEPQMLARQLPGTPIVVGADRVASARWALRAQRADALLLDDGFQHRRLRRDCDVVLLHARTPFGGWNLLPRGPMREPVEALRRAHAVILTRSDQALETSGVWRERVRALNPAAVFATAAHELVGVADAGGATVFPPAHLDGKRVAALSSVGDPRGFETTLRQARAMILWHRVFPDHHPYTREEWKSALEQAAGSRADALVTTEKDWARLAGFAREEALPLPVWLPQVRMRLLSGEKELDARLARL